MTNSKKLSFGIVGSGGYIAQRHKDAIEELGHRLAFGIDPNSLNQGDSNIYQSIAEFKQEQSSAIDYITICSPSHLHCEHIIDCLSICPVICEKPFALHSEEIEKIQEAEQRTGNSVFVIRQLRYHPEILNQTFDSTKNHEIQIVFQSPRNSDYWLSWKGRSEHSGGILFNIGLHYLDLVQLLFGRLTKFEVDKHSIDEAKGRFSTTNSNGVFHFHHPTSNELDIEKSFIIDGKKMNLTSMINLHSLAIQEIIQGNGLGIEEAKSLIQFLEVATSKKS